MMMAVGAGTWARTALLASGVTFALGPLVLAGLRHRQIIDHPTWRSSHHLPTPRGGGIAAAAGASLALAMSPLSAAARLAIVVPSVVFALIGLGDDLRHLHALLRLALQVLLAAGTLWFLLHGLTGNRTWQVIFPAGVVVWLVGYVNAFNFMDGINGIAGVQALIAGGTWAYLGRTTHHSALAMAGLAVAAAALGFLPFNFPRARFFLGDVGSYFLGAWLAATTIVGLRDGLPLEAVVAPLALFLVDVAYTLVARVLRGATWHESHHEHTYQQIVDGGWSHTRTTLTAGAAMASVAALGLVSTTAAPEARAAADIAGAFILAAYLAAPSFLKRSEAVPTH